MHKQEASILFGVLSDEDRLKMMKFLCVKGNMGVNDLLTLVNSEEKKFDKDLSILLCNNLVSTNEGLLVANIDLVNELMNFITTPCKCMK